VPDGMTCAVCGGPAELRWRSEVVEVGRARAGTDRLPTLVCLSEPDHGASGVDEVQRVVSAAIEHFSVARRGAIPGRAQRCRACRSQLTMPGFRSERAVTIVGAGLPAATLRLDLPLWRCPGCGIENVPREAWVDALQAIRAVAQPSADR